jgi:hypothetical protein
MNLTVPMQAGGVKSLPAELKGWGRPVAGPGGPYFGGGPAYRWPPPGGRLRGLGDDPGLDPGIVTPTIDPGVSPGTWTNPVSFDAGGNIQIAPTAESNEALYAAAMAGQAGVTADTLQALYNATAVPSGYAGPLTLPVGAAAPAAPSGYQWAQLINAAGSNMVQVLAATRPGTSYTQLPNGTRIVYSQNPGYAVQPGVGAGLTIGSGGVTAGISGSTMLLVAAVALMFVMGRK